MRLAGWHGDRWRRTTTVLTAAVLAAALAAGIAAAPSPDTAAHDVAAPPARATPRPTLTLPTLLTIPGNPATLPWPAAGQAALAVPGVGDLGTSGPDRPAPIASVAKVMTAYLVLTHHPLAPGAQGPTMTVTAQDTTEYAACRRRGEAALRVTAGETLTERQALEAMLLPSANNIARMLARWDQGSLPAFVAQMNTTAGALGMTRTRYTDPAGFDPATVSTATDQLRLAAQVMRVPALAAIVGERTATLPVVGPVTNVNRLLGTGGVIGIKTGSMTRSGGCLLFAARLPAGGVPVTVLGAVLGQPMPRGGLATAFAASQALLAGAARTVAPHTLLHAGDPVARLPDGATLVADQDVTVLGWPGLAFLPVLDTAVPAAGPAGARVGRLLVAALPAGSAVTVPLRVRRG